MPGDAGDFPIKQAFLAFLQADAVANHITAEVSGRPFDQPFDSVSMCVMEMFDKATFAQVPVELTGDPDSPVRVRPDAQEDYKVGTSQLWRIGMNMLGLSVPMRCHAGEPFHAGAAWQAMDVGLKAMSGMLAELRGASLVGGAERRTGVAAPSRQARQARAGQEAAPG